MKAGSRRAILSVAVLTAAAMVAPAAWALAAPDVPAAFAVCVTTVDAGGRARLDGYYSVEAEAKDRRAEILRAGWVTEGDSPDEEDEYPPHSIVKATVDGSLDASICAPRPAIVAADRAGSAR